MSLPAGLEAGDIIVSFAGEVLTGRYPPPDPDESEPAIKLIDLVRDHDPGDEVTVEYRRSDRTQSTIVTLDGGGGLVGSWFFIGEPGDFEFEWPRVGFGQAPRGDVRVAENHQVICPLNNCTIYRKIYWHDISYRYIATMYRMRCFAGED